MAVIQLVGVLFEVFYRIHVRVVQVTGVQTQTGNLVRNIADNLFNLVRKLDVAACMRMDDRAHTPFVCAFTYSADVAHEARPLLVRQTRRGVRMACGVVALVVSPVHNGHVRRGELLAVVGLEYRQLGVGDQAADVVNRVQHALLIVCVEQIVENGACYDGETVLAKLVGYQLCVNRQVAVRAKLDGAVTGFTGFLQYARPGR